MTRAEGFGPVFDGESRLLILGSFPSVKSRAEGFYYGNPQNRFWRTLCAFFGEEIPQDVAGKRALLLRNRVALWDVVASCEIAGSADRSIREERIADIPALLAEAPVERIFCNGSLSHSLLTRHFPALGGAALRLPSTSPANPRFRAEAWYTALAEVFGRRTL